MNDKISSMILNDIYGNVVSKIYMDEDKTRRYDYRYNDYNDLLTVSLTFMDTNGNVTGMLEYNYVYEYDDFGNKIRQSSVRRRNGVEQPGKTYFFINEYDEENHLKKCTITFENNAVCGSREYFYEADMLVRECEYNAKYKEKGREKVYHYNADGKIEEVEVRFPEGHVAYYIKYTMLYDGKYKTEVVSPYRKEQKWMISGIAEEQVTVIPKEATLTTDTLKEIVEYLSEKLPHIRHINIELSDADSRQYEDELKEYKELCLSEKGMDIIYTY